MTEAQAEIARYVDGQARVCEMLGAPLYASMLDAATGQVERGRTLWSVLEPFAGEPKSYGLPLKLMGAVHRLVLEGRAPELAPFYPSVGGSPDLEAAPLAFEAVIERHAGELGELIARPVQTNEVGRCAALLGGFLEVARQTGLDLRLLEIGASAGLNLRWDRYLYNAGEASWGNPDSKVRCLLDPATAPPLDVEAIVGSRRGCDTAPLDPADEQDRITLLSYVWPDQAWRLELLRAALDEAAAAPVLVENADAVDWIGNALDESVPGVATVVFHSLVWFWMDEPTRERLKQTITAAGERATKHRPLAWLRMENGDDQANVDLTIWPGASRAWWRERGTTDGP